MPDSYEIRTSQELKSPLFVQLRMPFFKSFDVYITFVRNLGKGNLANRWLLVKEISRQSNFTIVYINMRFLTNDLFVVQMPFEI